MQKVKISKVRRETVRVVALGRWSVVVSGHESKRGSEVRRDKLTGPWMEEEKR